MPQNAQATGQSGEANLNTLLPLRFSQKLETVWKQYNFSLTQKLTSSSFTDLLTLDQVLKLRSTEHACTYFVFCTASVMRSARSTFLALLSTISRTFALSALFAITWTKPAICQDQGIPTAEGDSPNVSGGESSNRHPSALPATEEVLSSHQLHLSAAPGMLSWISIPNRSQLSSGEQAPSMRALIEIDNRFLSIPFREQGPEEVLYALFPSPQHSLRYRLEQISPDGRRYITNYYGTQIPCDRSELQMDPTSKIEAPFPKQPQGVEKAVSLFARGKLLEQLIESLESLPVTSSQDRNS